MAFHQTTRQAAQRVFRPAVDEETHHAPQPASQALEESQTWVLFSPATEAGTVTTYLTETHNTQSTPGRSRLSDLGSIHTAARSENSISLQQSASFDAVDEEEEEDDDAELDSLDSHLPEFRSTPDFFTSAQGLAPIVPAHDGLGSFRIDHDGMGPDVQDRLYAFEQYNPRRIKRRRESLERAQVELERDGEQEMDKMQRIETWRLEQSRCILEEIQKETRRRRRSAASTASTRPTKAASEDVATLHQTIDSPLDSLDEDDAWHEQQASDLGDRESVWSRITRKVIRDIMGIDDKLLSVLFGESLPDEDDLSTTPKASTMLAEPSGDTTMTDSAESSWQLKMLERIAKELGLFVHQISEHPGAFSTFTRVQQMAIPYAGLPSIPESASDMAKAPVARDSQTTIPEFRPTVGPQSRPIDVPNARTIPGYAAAGSHAQGDRSANNATFTEEEWEKDLDVRLVFRYLRSRFASISNSTSSNNPGNSHAGAPNNQDAAAKAARVRQHHPLVSKLRPSERRPFKATTPPSPVLFKHASSCASQSTRRSVRRSSCSSRHYWDIGAGSVGTGSIIATTGPMGSWGEV